MTTARFAGRPYVIYVPDDYRGDEPFPLLINLSGGPGRAMTGVLGAQEVLAQTDALVLFPQAGGLWWEEGPAAGFAALLEEVLSAFNVDTNRVYLMGSSNGGTGAFLYATLWPDRFAAVVSLMGGGIPFFGDTSVAWKNLSLLPILFVHGEKDEVIPVRATRQTYEMLTHAGFPVEMKILAGRGHELALGSDDGLALPFLRSHRREPFLSHAHVRAGASVPARQAWLEVTEKDSGDAEAEATLSGRSIQIQTKHVKRLRLLLRRELIAAPGPLHVTLNGREAYAGAVAEDCGLLESTSKATNDPFRGYSSALELIVPR
jgi:pimeloyl-ACP methyl ester carboxylesterase